MDLWKHHWRTERQMCNKGVDFAMGGSLRGNGGVKTERTRLITWVGMMAPFLLELVLTSLAFPLLDAINLCIIRKV
jgi:hypothetical protein